MAVSPIGVLVGLVLIFFAPGYFLLHALFPGRRYFGPFHPFALPALSVVVSVAITVVVGSLLGFVGRFDALMIELTLGSLAGVLFLVGWWRGSFPLLGREAEYDNIAERGEPEEVTMLRDLRLEEERLRQETNRVRKRARASRDLGVRGALSDAARDLAADRREIAQKARTVEAKAGERRYGREGTGPRLGRR